MTFKTLHSNFKEQNISIIISNSRNSPQGKYPVKKIKIAASLNCQDGDEEISSTTGGLLMFCSPHPTHTHTHVRDVRANMSVHTHITLHTPGSPRILFVSNMPGRDPRYSRGAFKFTILPEHSVRVFFVQLFFFC